MFDRDFSIYLDSEFVVRKYEEITNSTPAMTITKTQDVSAKAGWFGVEAGAAVQETKSFSVSSWQMLEQIWESLSVYPQFSGTYSLKPLWFSGFLGMGKSEHIRGSSVVGTRTNEPKTEKLGEHWYFVLQLPDGINLPLVTKQQYFTSGYDQLLANVHGPCTYVWISVSVLAKVLFFNREDDVVLATPYLIFSNSNDGGGLPSRSKSANT
jgi:hypothetical protein